MNAAEARSPAQSDLLAEPDQHRPAARGIGRGETCWRLHAADEADPAADRRRSVSFLLSQVAEHRAKIAALSRQQAQKEAERATIAASIAASWRRRFRCMQQRVDIRRTLVDKEIWVEAHSISRSSRRWSSRKQDLGVQKSQSARGQAAAAPLIGNAGQAEGRVSTYTLDELAKAEQKASGLPQELIKAEQRTKLQLLTAPVDGVVQQLAVHTVGGVVTPAQALLVVVPSDSQLEIEAMVSNRDIGFVQPGQEAEIKIDTFNFTRYGLLTGSVLSVSQDAIIARQANKSGPKSGLGDAERAAASRRARS